MNAVHRRVAALEANRRDNLQLRVVFCWPGEDFDEARRRTYPDADPGDPVVQWLAVSWRASE